MPPLLSGGSLPAQGLNEFHNGWSPHDGAGPFGLPGMIRLSALLYPATSRDTTLAKAGAAWITQRGRRPPRGMSLQAGRGRGRRPPGWLATLDA